MQPTVNRYPHRPYSGTTGLRGGRRRSAPLERRIAADLIFLYDRYYDGGDGWVLIRPADPGLRRRRARERGWRDELTNFPEDPEAGDPDVLLTVPVFTPPHDWHGRELPVTAATILRALLDDAATWENTSDGGFGAWCREQIPDLDLEDCPFGWYCDRFRDCPGDKVLDDGDCPRADALETYEAVTAMTEELRLWLGDDRYTTYLWHTH